MILIIEKQALTFVKDWIRHDRLQSECECAFLIAFKEDLEAQA